MYVRTIYVNDLDEADEIIKMFSSVSPRIEETENGFYKLVVEGDLYENYTQEYLDSLIEDISYQPLIFKIIVSTPFLEDVAKQIIITATGQNCQVEVRNNSDEENWQIVCMNGNDFHYVKQLIYQEIKNNLERLLHYRFIGKCKEIINYIMERENINKNLFTDIITVEDLVFTKIECFNPLFQEVYNGQILKVKSELDDLMSKKTVFYEPSLENIELARQIITAFNIPVIDERSFGFILQPFHPRIDRVDQWIEEAILNIKMDNFPKMPFIDMTDKDVFSLVQVARTKMALVLTYLEFIVKDKSLPIMFDFLLHSSRDIYISADSIDTYNSLYTFFEDNMNIVNEWYVKHFSSLEEALLEKIKNNGIAIIIPIENSFYLVSQKETTEYKHEEVSQMENILHEKLEECNGNIEIFSQENIKELPLSILMRIVISDDKGKYCFNSSVFKEKSRYIINPATRTPFSQKNTMEIIFNQLSLYGIFDNYLSKGLLNSLRPRPSLPLTPEKIIVERGSETMDVSIKYNEKIIELLTLCNTEISINNMINNIFSNGWILNNWSYINMKNMIITELNNCNFFLPYQLRRDLLEENKVRDTIINLENL